MAFQIIEAVLVLHIRDQSAILAMQIAFQITFEIVRRDVGSRSAISGSADSFSNGPDELFSTLENLVCNL